MPKNGLWTLLDSLLESFTKTTSKQQNKPLKGLKMIVKSTEFTSMKGHVADDCIIIAPSGRQFTLKNTIKGWTILRGDGSPCSGILPSAHDVEYFVVNGLYSN
jgi:hypothetical protein